MQQNVKKQQNVNAVGKARAGSIVVWATAKKSVTGGTLYWRYSWLGQA